MAKPKILIVEDDGIIGKHTEHILKRMGYDVLGMVSAGEDALELIAAAPPDLVLMDITLSGDLDGIETAAQIHDKFDIPVIYITAYTDDQILERARSTEPFGYLLKPFEERSLHTTVETALSKHSQQKRLSESADHYQAVVAAEHEQRTLAEALCDTSLALNSTLDLNEVFDRILLNLGKVMPHDTAVITLINHGIAEVVRGLGYFQYGIETTMRSARFDVAKTTTLQRMSETGQPIIIPDTGTFEGWIKLPTSSWIRSYAGAPIGIKGRVVGFLHLNSGQPGFFNESHARRLQIFANQAAIAIENARLYDEVRQMAITDELTGLYNRRGIISLGEREVQRTLRFGRPLAVVLIDIDEFKHINDTFGHAGGDQVLRALADCCRANLREIDLIGRYGGDEFLIILPETDTPTVEQVAERLRRQINTLHLPPEMENISVSVSMGIATMPGSPGDLSGLIQCADQALYTAKSSGRNRVVTSQPS